MATKDKFSILAPLAKELGYKDVKEMRDALGKGKSSDREKLGSGKTGFLGGRKVGSGFGEGIQSRLIKGASIKESVAGGFKDFKESFSKENIKRRLLENTFSGKGIVDKFARGHLKKKFGIAAGEKKEGAGKAGEKKGGAEAEKEGSDNGSGIGGDSASYLQIIAKNSMSFHLMSRDLNVLRQNIVTLTKLEAGKYNKDKPKKKQVSAAVSADAFFLREDEREAKLEAERASLSKPTQVGADEKEKEKEDGGGGLLESIMSLFTGGILSSLKSLFSPMMLLKLFSKIFVPATIIISLFKGIIAAWEKWKETGDLKEAVIAGLGAIVDFLTFGFFGEDSVRNLFSKIESFINPVIDTIKDVYYKVKDWIVNNVGIPKIDLGNWFGKPRSIGPWYPLKSNPKSAEDEKSDRGAGGAEPSKPPSGEPIPAGTDGAAGASGAAGTDGAAGASGAAGAAGTDGTAGAAGTDGTARALGAAGTDGAAGALGAAGTDGTAGTDGAAGGYGTPSTTSTRSPTSVPAQSSLAEYVRTKEDAEIEKALSEGRTLTPEQRKRVEEVSTMKAGQSTVSRMPMSGAAGEQQLDISATPASEPDSSGLGETGGSSKSPSVNKAGGTVTVPSVSGDSSAPAPGGAASISPPTPDDAPGAISSGASLDNDSQQIAEQQRMESSADMGSTVNAPVTNNSQSATGKGSSKLPDAYDNTLALAMARA